MKFYYVRGIFDLQDFDNETRALSKFFAICMEMRFVSLKKKMKEILQSYHFFIQISKIHFEIKYITE